MFQRSSLRYAHTNGYTFLIYTENGEFMITCGSDGDIRKWQGIDDDDPSSNCLGEFVIAIAQSGERLLASTDRNTLQAYTFPALDSDGILMRFTSPVTCICVRKPWIAAGSDDMHIKLKQDNSTDCIDLEGHKGPILALDICIERNLLASISGDGCLKIWQLSEDNQSKEIKSISGLPKANCFESAQFYGTPTFEPQNGRLLAYAKGRELIVLDTISWEIQYTLKDEANTTSEYTCCQFSSDGLYLAGGTRSGEISVFDFMRSQPINCEAPSSDCQAITCLTWHPCNNKELAYCDVTGQLGTIFRDTDAPVAHNAGTASMSEGVDVDFDDMQFQDDEAHEANDESINGDVDGDDDDDDNNENAVSIRKLKKKIMGPYENIEEDHNTRDSVPKSDISEKSAYVKTFKPQDAFQPSSTPNHLEHHYLAWNDVGIVTSHVADSTDGAIDVEFHDASVHHALHITNYQQHNIASLSKSVLALASTSATKLVCIALAASGSKEWQVSLPDCETVDALAATDKLIGVATSMQFLRLFTVMGTQREVISLPGPVVAMAGHDERLLVCYHQAPPSNTQQHMSGMLLQMQGMRLRTQEIRLPLPPERLLNWLGFSDCGSPAFCDNMGLLQLYSMSSNCWFPVCDTMKHTQSVSNNYFIISVSESAQNVGAVLCRGTSYPMTNPRPIIQELPMQLPICDAETEKSQLEDALVRSCSFDVTLGDKHIKETAIKLFALACRSELEARAKELIETIGCTDLLLLAVKYATKLGRIHLSDRLTALAPQIEEQKQQQQHYDNSLPNSPFITESQATTPNGNVGLKLAPKLMDVNSTRRQALKRFSASALKKPRPSISAETLLTPVAATASELIDHPAPESSEKFGSVADSMDCSEYKEHTPTRGPPNGALPFAVKRKRTELDGGPLAALDKLKYTKK